MTNSLREDEGAGETNLATPDQSVVAVCAAEAAPRQRTWTSTLLTPFPVASAIITAPAAVPSRRKAAVASAYSWRGGEYELAFAIASAICGRPEPEAGLHPDPFRGSA